MKGSCEGYRIAESNRADKFGLQVSRRGLLASLGMGAVGWLGIRSALSQAIVTGDGAEHSGDVLISVFLRGGMDGLSAVVPFAEDAYHRARPNLRLRSPNDASLGKIYQCLDLDGFFGLNPAMSALLPIFREGRMAVVHAVGSGDQTRSHFEAMNAMERGMYRVGGGHQAGWVARHLESTPRKNPTPLRAVALSSVTPDSLRGASNATTLASLADFRLVDPEILELLTGLYGDGKDLMSQAGRDTLQVLEKLKGIKIEGGSKRYPSTGLGQGLSQVETLIRAGVGLEIACLEMGGWDTHVAQGTITGWLPSYLKDLADSLAAFVENMGQAMERVTVVVQTEFGRRVAENTGLGTDHGRASCMFLLGGGVNGGKVYADWPGLEAPQLDEVGDLKVSTDYRDVWGDALAARISDGRPDLVFPGWSKKHAGYFKSITGLKQPD